jgi:hypothetical protein
MLALEQKAEVDRDVFALKLATYQSDPANMAEAIFPEFYGEPTTEAKINELAAYEGEIVWDLDPDEDMNPARMEELLAQFH